MKKICSILACLCIMACTSTNKGTQSLNVEGLSLRARPLAVSIVPGEKIYGTAKCVNFLGIPLSSPSKQAYGAKLETQQGNFAGDNCTRGAIYDAIVSSNADLILSPQYVTTGTSFLCLPWIGCMYNDRTITVTGRKGTYVYDNEVPAYETAPLPIQNTYEAPMVNVVETSEIPATDVSEIPIYVIE
ncbi:MAG: hypothetical protein IJ677_09180 [Alphaproteobacteria bacterium]|nr:hypothetical protein [Alphaproteobacteria bacterium]